MRAIGLKTHLWNNQIKSLALMAGFPLLLFLVSYAIALGAVALGYGLSEPAPAADPSEELGRAWDIAVGALPITALAGLVWFAIAWMWHQAIIDAIAKARPVGRKDEPRFYNLLENLCISRGLPVPSLRVIETDALNAYASGLRPERAAVTVTRGLLNGLDDAELEAVLAHELSHIRHGDVRLLVVATIFVGIFAVLGEIAGRSLLRGASGRVGLARRGRGGQAGVLLLAAVAILGLCWLMGVVIRLALSRSREYMADAGAVELTRNPDAMVSALEKVSGRHRIEDVPAELRQMFLHDARTDFMGLLATHPPLERRIAALRAYAGAQRSSASI